MNTELTNMLNSTELTDLEKRLKFIAMNKEQEERCRRAAHNVKEWKKEQALFLEMNEVARPFFPVDQKE